MDNRELLYRDLCAAYEAVRRSHYRCKKMRLYEMAVNLPAPRYYVTPRSAYLVIYPLLLGRTDHFVRMKEAKRELYISLYTKVVELSRQREYYGKGLMELLPFALRQPAPRFFISPIRARHIIKEYLCEKKSEKS